MTADNRLAADSALVIGEALIDIVHTEAGVPEEHVGGSPANVALGLGRLGLHVRFRTAIAHDARGERIAAHLAHSGVVVDEESFGLDRTSTAVAWLSSQGDARYEFDVSWRIDQPVELGSARLVHVGSLGCFIEPGASVLRRTIESWGDSVSLTFDPNIRPALAGDRTAVRKTTEEVATRCELVKLSDEDAAWLYPGATVDDVLSRFLSLGTRVVAVTLGRRGAVLASSESRVDVAPMPVRQVDSVGAGDTFMAMLVASLAAGELGADSASLRVAGERAAAAAAITVGRRGADLPTRAELGAALR